MSPLVSIIIPVYNGGNFLRKAIESAINQTCENCEVLVVNDGSSDDGETARIAQSYGDRIRYFEKSNGGVSSALNYGIREMKGDWFAWLSHDDEFAPNRVEADLKLLGEQPEVKVLFCRTIFIDSEGRVIGENKIAKTRIEGPLDVLYQNGMELCSMTIHRTCFDTVGMFNETNRMTQDVEMALRLSLTYPFVLNSATFTRRRQHPQSGTNTQRASHKRYAEQVCAFILSDIPFGRLFPMASESAAARVTAWTDMGNLLWGIGSEEHAWKAYRKAIDAQRGMRKKISLWAYLMETKGKNGCLKRLAAIYRRLWHSTARWARSAKVEGVNDAWRPLRQVKILRVLRHKAMLASQSEVNNSYSHVAFVFQTFNKAKQIESVITPIVRLTPANVILFADGCIDKTAGIAHELLRAKNHVVFLTNDTHEIRNYRLSVAVARQWGCRYVVLLQDDDVYGVNFQAWLDSALTALDQDRSAAILGGNAGFNTTTTPPKRADDGLVTAHFASWSEGGRRGYSLGDYEERELSNLIPTPDGSAWEYVATVNRAPQIVRIESAIDLGFFPSQMEPYQYDDDYNCFTAWMAGYKVIYMPMAGKRANVGGGGMRLYNAVGVESRPCHFIHNWNYVYDRFSAPWISGELQDRVRRANACRMASQNSLTER